MKSQSLVLILCILLFSSLSQSKELRIDSKNSKIAFVAVGRPAALKISGQITALQARLNEDSNLVNGSISLQLKELSTGIDLRDQHLKEKYLEMEKFPTALLNLKNLRLTTPTDNLNSNLKNLAFQGTLSLHGVEKNISGEYDLTPNGDSFSVHATFILKISDYGIQIPSYMGITVADNVTVQTDLIFKK